MLTIECGSTYSLEDLLLNGLFHDNGNGTYTAIAGGTTTDLTALIAAVNAVKTSVDSVKTDIDASNVLLAGVRGKDFLVITDTNAHTGLNCYAIGILADAVFSSIVVGGSNVVTVKGLAAITIPFGSPVLPFGTTPATAITLTSGKVIAFLV